MTSRTTEYSALMSKVMSNGNGNQTINEPAEGKKKSNRRIFRLYGGPGIQQSLLLQMTLLKP
jgi:hypothetical protein